MGQAWQFGRNQTRKQEMDEIKRAKAEGDTADYMAGQRWARTREPSASASGRGDRRKIE